MTSPATEDANVNSSGSIVAAGTVFTDDYFDEYGVPKPRLFARSRESDGKTEYKVFPIKYKVGQTHPLVHDAESGNLQSLTSYLGADVAGYKLVTTESTLNPEEGALILSAFKNHAGEVCDATSYLEGRHLDLLKTSESPGGAGSLTNHALSIHACDIYAASIPSVVANFMYSVREQTLGDSPHKSSLTRAPGKIYAKLATNFLRLDEELAERAGSSCSNEGCQGETAHLRDALHDSTNADLNHWDGAGEVSDSVRLWEVLENREGYLESRWTVEGLENTLERLRSGHKRRPLVSSNSTTGNVVDNTARWLEGAFRSFGQPHYKLSQGLGLDTESVALGGSHKPFGSSHSESSSSIHAHPAALQSYSLAESLAGGLTQPGATPSPSSSSPPPTIQTHNSVTRLPVSSPGFVLQDTSDEKQAPASSTVASKDEKPQHGSPGLSVRKLLAKAKTGKSKYRRHLIEYPQPAPNQPASDPMDKHRPTRPTPRTPSTIDTTTSHQESWSEKKPRHLQRLERAGSNATGSLKSSFTTPPTSRTSQHVQSRPLPTLPALWAGNSPATDLCHALRPEDSKNMWKQFRTRGSQGAGTVEDLSQPAVTGISTAQEGTAKGPESHDVSHPSDSGCHSHAPLSIITRLFGDALTGNSEITRLAGVESEPDSRSYQWPIDTSDDESVTIMSPKPKRAPSVDGRMVADRDSVF